MFGLLSKKTSDSLIFFSLVIFVGGAFVTWNFFVKPMNAQLKGVQAQVAEIGKKKVAAENLTALERRYEGYSKVVSKTQLLSWLIDESSRMAADSNVTLISAAPGSDTPIGPEFRKITLRVEARGGYHELGDFVSRIENSERFIKINDCHLSKGTDPSEPLSISLTLSIFTEKGAV